ncbi:GNAT family N-acyltransferase [Agaribacter flavus]|uniref:L-ornithine N(alpha)-acyltransferase n=1 Tax=Agaribacter flavus TaxID=1902781 RepID=A0ABV7FMJ0_9ALTE
MLNTQQVIQQHFPKVAQNKLLSKPTAAVLKRLLCEKEINEFTEQYPHFVGFDFVEQVLEYFSFAYSVSDNHRERIPQTGRLVIIANHPIGSLDGLALIKLIREIRDDIKVIANEMLMAIEPLHSILLPVNNMSGGTKKENLHNIDLHLQNEGVVIIFPAGEVSRLRPQGIRDTKWHSGFLRIAKANQSPILPIFIDAKNSALFYGVSMLFKPAATALLVKQMWHQKEKNIPMKIGEVIPHEAYSGLKISLKEQVKLFKRHLYRIAKNKTPLMATQAAIALPEDRRLLVKALEHEAEMLGKTGDGKSIYLFTYKQGSVIMRELGRLREITFREVGEGTNKRRDIDKYDKDYYHLVLWDEKDLEIAGAYRFGHVESITEVDKLYSSTLFDYTENMDKYLSQGLELGRSFVQKKYWGKRSLDYLWQGLGAFVRRHPEYRYLFGPVSISNRYPNAAIELIVAFYFHFFPANTLLAKAKIQYSVSQEVMQRFQDMSYKEGFSLLKNALSEMGVTVPTLYKQYAETYKPGGVSFCAFNVDPNFEYCVDGLIVADLTQLTDKKRKRYLDPQD